MNRSAESSLPGLLSNRALHCVPDLQLSPWLRWTPGVLARPALPVSEHHNVQTRSSRSGWSRTVQNSAAHLWTREPVCAWEPSVPWSSLQQKGDPRSDFPGSDIMKRILAELNSPSLLEVLEGRWIQRHHEVHASRLLPSGPADPELHGHPNRVHKSIINGPAS